MALKKNLHTLQKHLKEYSKIYVKYETGPFLYLIIL